MRLLLSPSLSDVGGINCAKRCKPQPSPFPWEEIRRWLRLSPSRSRTSAPALPDAALLEVASTSSTTVEFVVTRSCLVGLQFISSVF